MNEVEMSFEFDTLIKFGRILDGTGNPWYAADIGIRQGRITRIQKEINPQSARRLIDASGLAVSPGFIDTHSHDDVYLLMNPQCDEKILQGVTTDVVGNCGITVSPRSEEHRDDSFIGMMCGRQVNADELQVKTFDDYLSRLEALKPGINVLSLVGHSTVRIAAMGAVNRAPSGSELKDMKARVARAMEEGAFGLSTGLIYAPGNYAGTEEILELAGTAGRYRGVYATHMRSEGDAELAALAEAVRIGREASIPVHISHHKVVGKQNWGRSVDTLKTMAEAREQGVQVTCDQYPYRAGSTFLAAVLPPAVLDGGPEIFSSKLKDPAFRAQAVETIERGAEEGWENLIKGAGFENLMIAVSRHRDYVGKSISDIAAIESRSPYEVIFDLVVEEGRSCIIILFMMDEGDIIRIMQNPWTMVATDGIPGFGGKKVHPRMSGTFPRVLGRYVREKGVLTIEEAIRKMTSLPAQTFGVRGKGLLLEGFDADVVVFDPATILDKATYEDPNQGPVGIRCVLVNGEIAAEDGKVKGATSGKVLRHGN
jgi:N-acyl-D-amino-acid deacylase